MLLYHVGVVVVVVVAVAGGVVVDEKGQFL